MNLDTRARASAQAIRRSRTRLDAVAGLDELLARRRRQPLRRAAVAFAVLVVVAAIWAGLGLRGPTPIQPTLGPVTRFPVGPAPLSVAVTPEAAWVLNANDGTITRIDPGTGQVRPSFTVTWGMLGVTIPVDEGGREAPVLLHYATVAEGRLWVVHPGNPPDERVKVTALDASTGRLVTTFKPGGWLFDPYGKPGDLAIGPRAVWVALQGDDQVRRFDPTTGKLVDWYALKEPTAVAVDDQTAWVATADGRLHRIDTATGAVTVPATTELVYRIRVGQGGVWLMTFDGKVLRLDRRTGKVVAQVPGSFRAADLAVGAEGVWVYDQHRGAVLRIDPATNRVARTIPVISQPLVEVSSRVLALGGGAVWLLDKGGEALVRVDPNR
jgi:DNA-binding beta-propeller fold protein YncE